MNIEEFAPARYPAARPAFAPNAPSPHSSRVEKSFDVLVIGGGAAGIAAGIEAARHGAKTGLVRPSPGATALSHGGWSGDLPGRLADALAAVGLPHGSAPHPLPHPAGTLVSYDAAPPWHTAAKISDGTLVCGIAGLPGFHAPALARLWGDEGDTELMAHTLDAGPATPAGGWSAVALAAALERDPGPLADSLATAVRETGALRVVLPPVLGRDRVADIYAALENAADTPVAEALAGPAWPSIPGRRLDRALVAAAEAADIEILRARVVASETEGVRMRTVTARQGGSGSEESAAAGEPLRLHAAAFVLATGKFIGGGIVADDYFREPALDCPVWIEYTGAAFERNEPLALTATPRAAAQRLFGAGVHTDNQARPVDRWGEVVYENVFAAGSVRAGRSGATRGLGTAAGDGIAAGLRAADAAGTGTGD